MGNRVYCFKCLYCNYNTCGTLHDLYVITGDNLMCPNCRRSLTRDYKAEHFNFVLHGDGFYSNENRDRQEV